jgi:hypothetical protein
MPMGYGSNYADVIDEKDVRKLCPKEYKEFEKAIEEADETLESVAQEVGTEDVWENDEHPITKAFDNLQTAFEEKTDLTLYLSYHNADDDGSCYDDINGAYFCVDGMYELTPAGKKFNKIVQKKMFVTFG